MEPGAVAEHGLWQRAVDPLLDQARALAEAVPSVAVGLVVLALFWLGGRAIRALLRRSARRRRKHRNVALVLGRLGLGGMLLVGTLLAAVIVFPNFTPSKLVEVLGLGSVAVGFAFRDVLQNYLAGILLLLTEPFRIDDQVVYKEYEGTVEEIQTRATFIRTYDGRRVVVPNGELFTNPITVNTAFPERRVEVEVGIGYGDDPRRAREIVLETLRGIEDVLEKPPPDVLVVELGESSVVLRVRWWIVPPRMIDTLASRDAVLAEVKRALSGAGIDLPYPTRQILFHDQTEATDGDRARQREGWPAVEGEAPRPAGLGRELARAADALRGADANGRGTARGAG